MTITYIACVVGFFFLAFAIGFCAGVTHERDTHWTKPNPDKAFEVMGESERKQFIAKITRAANCGLSEEEVASVYNEALSMSPKQRNDWLYGDFEVDNSNAVFKPELFDQASAVSADWAEPLTPVLIMLSNWEIAGAEKALQKADAYFESTFNDMRNTHTILTAKENLDVLKAANVHYAVIQ